MPTITYGCDPEFFLKKGNMYQSAHGMIPGTKKSPYKVKGGAIQVDGMAVEFNIDPVETEDEFVDNIHLVLSNLEKRLPEYKFVFKPAINFSDRVMEKQPNEALVLGCEPDFNAWRGTANLPPISYRNQRTASGHIHVGWGEGFDVGDASHFEVCSLMAQVLDYYVGFPMTAIEPLNLRRKMYGTAGAFRPKSYGMEYRTPSNYWLNNENLMRFVFKQTKMGVTAMLNGNLPRRVLDDDRLAKMINNSTREQKLGHHIYQMNYKVDTIREIQEFAAKV